MYKMDIKSKVLNFAENHCYILLASVIILIFLVLFLYFGSPKISGFKGGAARGAKGKKSGILNSTQEIDDLIESIHSKQRN